MTTGRSLGPLIGAVIGGVLVGVGTFGAATPALVGLGISLGGALGGIGGGLYDTATAPDTTQRQPTFADISVQTSALGLVIPQVWGSASGLAGNCIWSGTKRAVEERTVQEQGGGSGGGPALITITTHYLFSYALGLCDTRLTGPIEGIDRIYRDATLFWDRTVTAALPQGWTFYSGAADQAPPDLIEDHEGAGNVPGYQYLCLVTVEDDNLGATGRTFNYTFDLVQSATDSRVLSCLAVDPSDQTTWVIDSTDQQIWRFNPETLARTAAVQMEAIDSISHIPICPIAVDASGDAWAVNTNTFKLIRVLKADNTGAVIATFTDATWDPLPLAPSLQFFSNIVFAAGDIWVAASYLAGGSVQTGILLRTTPGGTLTPLHVGASFSPRLAVDQAGYVWVSGGADGTVERINPADNSAEVVLGFIYPYDILVGSDGDIWFADIEADTVFRYTATGTPTEIAAIPVPAKPVRLREAADGAIWVASRLDDIQASPSAVARIDAGNNAVTGSVGVEGIEDSSGMEQVLAAVGSADMWVLCRLSALAVRLNSSMGEVARIRTAAAPLDIAPGTDGRFWFTTRQGAQLARLDTDNTLFASQEAPNGLPVVVQALCSAAGLASGQSDVSLLPARRIGMTLVSLQAARAPLEQLALAYGFFGLESQGVLRFQPVGYGAVIAEIAEADSGAGEQGFDTQGWQIPDVDPATVPTEVEVVYISESRGFERASQRFQAAREVSKTADPRSVTLPLILSDQDARQRAQELCLQSRIQSKTFSGTLGRKYAHLEVGDRIRATIRGSIYPLILKEVSYGDPGLIDVTAVPDIAYTVGAIGPSPGAPVPPAPPPRLPQETTGFLLNLPSLTTTDLLARYHVAMVGEREPWPGGALYRSVDGGSSYSQVTAATLQAQVGSVALATDDADWHVLDVTTVIRVVLAQTTMVLSSVTDAALYAGSNLALVGEEILAYGVATLVSAGTYDLTRLLRGRQGTEYLTGTHGTNEPFLVFDTAVRAVSMTPADRFVERPYKTVTNEQSIALVDPQNFTPTAANLLPFDVRMTASTQDGADWLLNAFVRSRAFVGAEFTGIGFDPDYIGLRFDIFTNGSYATVIRSTVIPTAALANPNTQQTFTYTAAMQTVDHGAPVSTVYWKVYQLTSGGDSRADALLAA
jgi:hypothetical protein